jgi:hypothetical protein
VGGGAALPGVEGTPEESKVGIKGTTVTAGAALYSCTAPPPPYMSSRPTRKVPHAVEKSLQQLVRAVEAVRAEVQPGPGRGADVEGLVGVLVSHLLELWAVQLGGAHNVEANLRACL